MMNKPELLRWLQKENQHWEDILDQIGPRRMEQPGVNGDWSIKDLTAHLTGWNRWLVIRLQAAQRGDLEPPPPWPRRLQAEADINAWIYESTRGRTLGEVLEDTRSIFQQLLAVIQHLPEDVRIEEVWGDRAYYLVWVNGERYPVGEFFDHFRDDHEPDVRRWLSRAKNPQAEAQRDPP